MRKQLRKITKLLPVFFILLLQGYAEAATFTIADGDVAALKAAIITSNTNNQADIINLAPFGTYTLTSAEDNFEGDIGLPIVNVDGTGTNTALTINGNGATLTRSSAAKFRLLYCIGSTNINDLHFTNGDLGSDGNRGGALALNSQTYIITGCTFYSNKTDIAGGAIYLTSESYATVSNCTFTGNSAATGSAIYNNGATELNIYNTTIAGNATTSATGETVTTTDIKHYTYIRSSIITNNTLGASGREVSDATVLQGGSLIGSSKSTLITEGSPNASGDYVTFASAPIDAKLNALADNGGFTKTMSLQASSPAINKGSVIYIVDADQRGYTRTGGLDAGAFEYNGVVPAPLIATAGLDILMGPAGTVLTISGTNMTGITEIKFPGAAAVTSGFTNNTSQKVSVTVPADALSGQLTVTTAAGTSALSTQSFTVGTPAPVIAATGLSVTSGSAGTSLTISGTNLAGITQIKFQGAAAVMTGFTDNTATSVTVVVPAGASTGKITVTTAGGTSALSAQTFTVTTTEIARAITENVTIYPNPFEEEITIEFNEPVTETIDVKIVSINGEVVQAFILTELKTKVDTGTLTAGIYLVYVTKQNGEKNIYRIIKK